MRRDWLSAARVRGTGCSVLYDGLMQAICGRIDPLIDVSLVSNLQSTLGVVESACGTSDAALWFDPVIDGGGKIDARFNGHRSPLSRGKARMAAVATTLRSVSDPSMCT
jgi:hypothetical protein